MGDFQETVTSTALDNWGNYVRNPSPGGLVSWLLKSHHSVVRTSNPHEQYITRWGRKGGRGIDHIFYPRRDEVQAWVEEAIIEQQLGRLHFPSDHALLRLSIRRWIPDEDRQDAERVAYLFRRLADIRVRPKDDDRASIEFDDTQCRTDVVKEQEELFGSMQLITGESAPLTTQILGPVRDKLDELAMSLWKAAQEQGVDGPRGLLIRPTAGQVDRMEGIASEFDEAVKAVMAKGKLMWKGSATEMAKKARRKLQSAGEPTDFARMKTTTKLRFTRVEVQRVRARLLRINAAYAQKAMRRSVLGTGTVSP